MGGKWCVLAQYCFDSARKRSGFAQKQGMGDFYSKYDSVPFEKQ